MKKWIVLFFTLFIFTVTVNADAGNNVRYSSGGSSSSSNSYSSSSNSYSSSSRGRSYSNSRSSYSGSSFGLGGIEYIVVAGVIIYLVYNERKGRKNSYNPEEFTILQEERVTNAPSKVFYNPAINKKIVEIDPLFNENAFLAYAKEVYVKLQHAWTRKDWEEVRQYESENLYHTHSEQLQEYIEHQRTNVVERIGVKAAALYDFEVVGSFEHLTVTMSVVLRDYVMDDNTNQVIEGNPLEDLYVDYELVFIRNAGQKTRENQVMHALECPSCGSKSGINEEGICEYCGHQRVNDWVLNSLRSI